jgi:hypothetical protein
MQSGSEIETGWSIDRNDGTRKITEPRKQRLHSGARRTCRTGAQQGIDDQPNARPGPIGIDTAHAIIHSHASRIRGNARRWRLDLGHPDG